MLDAIKAVETDDLNGIKCCILQQTSSIIHTFITFSFVCEFVIHFIAHNFMLMWALEPSNDKLIIVFHCNHCERTENKISVEKVLRTQNHGVPSTYD